MFKRSKIACAIGFALCVVGPNANAGIISVALDADVKVEVPLGTSPQSDSDTGEVEVDTFISRESGSSYAQSTARALSTGWFYATSRAIQNASSSATILQKYVFQNDGDDGFFDFNFTVENGGLDIYCQGDGYGEGYGDGYGVGTNSCDATLASTAGYNANITVGLTSLWSSAATLIWDVNGYTLNTSGTLLNDAFLPGDSYLDS
ncbi:hypothetical protein [Alishewanella sp. HL-SH05]|uniref:hypothetical protein n=1 Tax=Alishewanella sp. HL-SH05 TaxID=3461145 RepID=UPI0040422960